jgi:hypothetical protein
VPLFDFTCLDCGEEQERLLRGKAALRCVACDSSDLRKEFTASLTVIGVSPTDPYVDRASGIVVETNADRRNMEKGLVRVQDGRGGTRVEQRKSAPKLVEKGSSQWKELTGRIHANEERLAKKQGVGNANHRWERTRRENKRRKEGRIGRVK